MVGNVYVRSRPRRFRVPAAAYATICRSRLGNGVKDGTAADAGGDLRRWSTSRPLPRAGTVNPPAPRLAVFLASQIRPPTRHRRRVFAGAPALYVYTGGEPAFAMGDATGPFGI